MDSYNFGAAHPRRFQRCFWRLRQGGDVLSGFNEYKSGGVIDVKGQYDLGVLNLTFKHRSDPTVLNLNLNSPYPGVFQPDRLSNVYSALHDQDHAPNQLECIATCATRDIYAEDLGRFAPPVDLA